MEKTTILCTASFHGSLIVMVWGTSAVGNFVLIVLSLPFTIRQKAT